MTSWQDYFVAFKAMFVICKDVLVVGIPQGGVVKFPDVATIQKALKRWREKHGLSQIDVVHESQKSSRNPFKATEVTRWEQGKTNFSYKRLVEDIIPAYGIRDADIFMDFCQRPSVEDVVCVRSKDRNISNSLFGRCCLVAPEFLKSNRTRVDYLKLPAGKSTPWGSHLGHEYVYLISGSGVWCEFAEDEEKKKGVKDFQLKPHDGVAFPSAIFHRFGNGGSVEAELVVARPTLSLPRGVEKERRSAG